MTSVGSLISVIIPCLNEVKAIDETLEPLLSLGADLEIIVVDGGSSDGTVDRVRAYPGIRLLSTRKGRGHQLDFGARAANGAMLWFLHADTLITPEAMRELRQAIADPVILSGNFTLIFSGATAGARFMTWLYHYLRLIGLCYGDSGYFVRAEVYYKSGGFNDYPLFEDLDLYRRLRRLGKFVRLPAAITTSSRRFENKFVKIFALWTFLQVLYWLGADPRWLGKMYRVVR
jgi:rSAM/selenodomain-associated transferase 2